MPTPTLDIYAEYLRDIELPAYGNRINTELGAVLCERLQHMQSLLDGKDTKQLKIAMRKTKQDARTMQQSFVCLEYLCSELIKCAFNTVILCYMHDDHDFVQARTLALTAMNDYSLDTLSPYFKPPTGRNAPIITPSTRTEETGHDNNN